MGWPTDQTLAQLTLEYRAEGVKFRNFIRRSATRYLEFFIIMMASFACGALLRDFAWFRILRRQWPFRERTTDWNEVERIASGG
jgi:hypothetical protein